MIRQISGSFEKQKDLVKAVKGMLDENSKLSRQVDRFQQNVLGIIVKTLEQKMEHIGDMYFIASKVDLSEASHLKDLAFRFRERYKKVCLVLGAEIDGKAHLAVMINDEVRQNYSLDAPTMIREISTGIQGGGGGQPFLATAGGKNPAGIDAALKKAREIVVDAVG